MLLELGQILIKRVIEFSCFFETGVQSCYIALFDPLPLTNYLHDIKILILS